MKKYAEVLSLKGFLRLIPNNIYVIDRGLQSTRAMKDFEEKSIKFIIRSKESRKFEEIESFLNEKKPQKWDDWEVVKDGKVKLYTGKPIQNKRGNLHYREEKAETHFRLVVIKNEKQSKEFWFLTKILQKEKQNKHKSLYCLIEICYLCNPVSVFQDDTM